MHYIRPSNERGAVDFGWLQSKHSFSFGNYYDNAHMGVSVLRVINDDTVAPGAGFGAHGHRDMEIVSYVTQGALEHKDNQGNHHIVSAGEVQRMSAGNGVIHSEYNASKTEAVKFLQIWIQPNQTGHNASYEQKIIKQSGPVTPIVTPNGINASVSIQQDASIYRLQLQPTEIATLEINPGRTSYLHLIKGTIKVNDKIFTPGDGFASTEIKLMVQAQTSEVEGLWFDLP